MLQLVDNKAEYPLGIYVPKAGEYTMAIKYNATDDKYSDLYLTLDGVAIWNLSQNPCVVQLEKGTNSRYGLRISPKVPQVTTAIDEAIVDSSDKTAAKILMNNHVYIIRDGKVYTITGQILNNQ